MYHKHLGYKSLGATVIMGKRNRYNRFQIRLLQQKSPGDMGHLRV
jgi:hypothetical protein